MLNSGRGFQRPDSDSAELELPLMSWPSFMRFSLAVIGSRTIKKLKFVC